MAAVLPTVLRVPYSSEDASNDSNFVLVHVSSNGSRPLDLKLTGTDNLSAFASQLKQHQTSSLKAKNCPCNQEDWDLILCHVLLGAAVGEGQQNLLEGVELFAKIMSDSLILTVQKRVQGIKQPLGSLTLPEGEIEDDSILYKWCGVAANTAKTSSHELESLRRELNQQKDRANRLNDSLEALIKAKTEHQNELLEKFALLLNEKKLKIRDQQRLLAGAKVDSSKLEAVEASRTNQKSRAAGPSRTGKRKAGKNARGASEESDSDGGFEKMEIDYVPLSTCSDQEQLRTPSGESTADNIESDDEPVAAPTRASVRGASKKPGKNATKPPSNTEPGVDEGPPPKRDLPFMKKTAPARPAPAVEGSETESDNEL